jgi:hypothetical protein
LSISSSKNKGFFYLDLIKSTLKKLFSDFNWMYYLVANNDLIGSGINDEKKAINHWNTYGMKELRICNKNFNKKYFTQRKYQEYL